MVVLLHLTKFDPPTRAFADRLAAESGHQLLCLADERKHPIAIDPYQKVSLTTSACHTLGLYCPDDFAWRCGDYGLYLARNKHPNATHVWLIEEDVRISGANLGIFFDFFSHWQNIDLLAPAFGASRGNWYWDHTITARNITIYRCLFPVIRLSARAIDSLLLRRREMAHSRMRRFSWPNDESEHSTAMRRCPFSRRMTAMPWP